MANIPSWAQANRTMLETDILTKDEQAENKKEDGKHQYKLKNYNEALTLFSEAIELCPENAFYYGNRAACYMMLHRFKQALDDARQAVRLDENFSEGGIRHSALCLREAKCHIALGDAASALRVLEKAKILDPNSVAIENELVNANQLHKFEEEAKISYDKKDFRKVVYCMDRALGYSVACSNFKLVKAECLAFLGRHDDAVEIANDMLQRDSLNADALYVRGMCLYYQDNVDKAFQHFQKVLKLAPDHQKAQDIYKRAKHLKAKKQAGNEAFQSGRYQEAYDIYSQALAIDPNNVMTNAKIYFNRATVCSKINKLNEALKDCSEAIHLDSTYEKAYLRRAKCYMDLEMFEDAVRDYEKVLEFSKKSEYKQLLRDAKKELKKSKRKDYYKILGIEKTASVDDIRKAYRKRALDHHPDRHANASDDIKREQEKKFKEVGEAYGILSDPKKRVRYDNGHDLEETEGFSDIDPNNIFQSFFGVPGHFSFETSNAGPGGFQQFPGGFSFQFA